MKKTPDWVATFYGKTTYLNGGRVLCVGVILTAPSGAQNHLPYSRLWQRQKAIAPFVLRRRPIFDGPHLTDSIAPNKNTTLRETLRKEVVSLGFYHYKTNDTLHKDCKSVIVGYIL